MNISKLLAKLICLFSITFFSSKQLSAHNGTVGYAYPLGKIVIDGDLSEWSKVTMKYPLALPGTDTKPVNDADFSGFFQVGYRAQERSLYLAFTITDDDFIEDTSANVKWDSQDALELYLDARHLPFGSGVASFMYSKKLRNTNNAYYDPFAKDAKWNIAEVAMVRKGNKRYYEWKLNLGEQFAVGKSIGLDFFVFDRDTDKSFSYNSWGPGEMKYVNPLSLADIILLPANEKPGTISGNVSWDKKMEAVLPHQVYITDLQKPQRWLAAATDSLGNYSVPVPAGNYKIGLADDIIYSGDKIYTAVQQKPITISIKAGQKINAERLIIAGEHAPHLVPEKGILQDDFTTASAAKVDQFIESYQKYYKIPGVSLALIKDGKLIYHKTYGVKNTFTKEPVDSNTLFEAASVTKPVFAFAVQRLAERGVIDLDKPLYLYLPNPDIAYDDRYKLMTARHVLSHRTGFPNWRSMNPDGKLDLKFTPGTGYGYSGEGFEYLKMVIEKITGKNVEQVLQEEVIQPIGLYHTFFSRNDSLRRMVATGHFNMLPNYDELPDAPGMAYSMHTEAKIFTKFMLYLLEQKGLNAKSYENMLSKHSDYPLEPGDEQPKFPTYMGVSLEIRETPFGKSFGHGGNNGDFKCGFRVYKDIKMGYVVFTNSNTSDALLQALGQFFVEGKDK